MPISVTIITRNEAHNIAAALESVRWADEIVVVDSESDDATVEIARRYTSQVIVRPWPGYAAQKQFAADQTQHPWILSLDADERVTPELAVEIQAVVARETEQPRHDGFYISRRNFYLGRAIRHSGWAPDYQLRLYRRERGDWRGAFVHESVHLTGVAGTLRGQLEHYSIRSLSAHHTRLDRYTTLAAEELVARGKPCGLRQLLLRPPIAFLRGYVWRLGFLDGIQGLMIAYFAGYYVFMKYAKAWERKREE